MKNSKKNSSAKQAPKSSLLTAAQRSQSARLAAYKAHTHKTFQTDRSPAERQVAIALYKSSQSTKTHIPTAKLIERAKDVRSAA